MELSNNKFIKTITSEGAHINDINSGLSYNEAGKLFTFELFLKQFKRKQLLDVLKSDERNKQLILDQIDESFHPLVKTPDYLHEFVRRNLKLKDQKDEKNIKTLSIVIKEKSKDAIRFLRNGISDFSYTVFDAQPLTARGAAIANDEPISLLQAETLQNEKIGTRLKYQFIKDGENSVLLTVLMDKTLLGKKIIGLFKKDRLIKSFETSQNTAYFPQIKQGYYSIKVNNATGNIIDTTNIEIFNAE